MQLALEEAAAAFAKGEVPIGAVLVHNGVAIARAHNLVEHTQDASAHAEMLCLRAAAAQLRVCDGDAEHCVASWNRSDACFEFVRVHVHARVQIIVVVTSSHRHSVFIF